MFLADVNQCRYEGNDRRLLCPAELQPIHRPLRFHSLPGLAESLGLEAMEHRCRYVCALLDDGSVNEFSERIVSVLVFGLVIALKL